MKKALTLIMALSNRPKSSLTKTVLTSRNSVRSATIKTNVTSRDPIAKSKVTYSRLTYSLYGKVLFYLIIKIRIWRCRFGSWRFKCFVRNTGDRRRCRRTFANWQRVYVPCNCFAGHWYCCRVCRYILSVQVRIWSALLLCVVTLLIVPFCRVASYIVMKRHSQRNRLKILDLGHRLDSIMSKM